MFPNVGFTIATIRIGEQFESEGILWVGSLMTILLVGMWIFVFACHVRAVVQRVILMPGKDEDKGELAYLGARSPHADRRTQMSTQKTTSGMELRFRPLGSTSSAGHITGMLWVLTVIDRKYDTSVIHLPFGLRSQKMPLIRLPRPPLELLESKLLGLTLDLRFFCSLRPLSTLLDRRD